MPIRRVTDWQTAQVHPVEATADTRRRIALVAALGAGAVAAAVAAIQLRHGIVPLLDSVTYWSGAESVASGRLFHTSLAPSFSNFDAVEFLQRRGTLPFVDFPVAYPLVAGSLGALIGTRAAMHLLAVVSVAVASFTIVRGGTLAHGQSGRHSAAHVGLLTVCACSIPFLPAVRLVTQGTLSEPLFIATTLLFVVALARFRRGGPWGPVAILVVVSSLLRFLGAPLALLAGWEHLRRSDRAGRSAAWTIALMAPAGANIVAASLSGGGHNAGWRGLNRVDVEVFVRSIGGWFDAVQGDIRRTYFTTDGPSWWAWPVAVCVLIAMAGGVIGVLRRRRVFTDAADIALASAAILTVGLIAGIVGFDALVIADNRLMLPAGILVMSAVMWTAIDRMRNNPVHLFVAACVLVMWSAVAARPWNALERFSDIDRPIPMSTVAAELGVEVIVSDDADGVHWDTGLPAVYTPMPVKPLTGEVVDDVEIYRRLPCPLREAHGAVVISTDSTFSTVNRQALDELVASGRLQRVRDDRATVYLPTESSCDG